MNDFYFEANNMGRVGDTAAGDTTAGDGSGGDTTDGQVEDPAAGALDDPIGAEA
jgi:hypothetical protein